MKKQTLILMNLLAFVFVQAQQLDMEKIEQKVDKLISKMTLEEKASLCSGKDNWSFKPINRLDIPSIWVAMDHMA
jgi:beta-glucosidase